MITPAFLNLIAGNVMHSPNVAALPTTYYVALSTVLPTDDAGTGFSEPSGGSYARGVFGIASDPVDGQIYNADDVEFVEATASWSTITAFGLYDSPVVGAGTLLAYDEVNPNQAIVSGNQARFKPGVLKVSFVNKETV